MKNCLDVKTYSCKDCNETFVAYADLHKHRQKVHTSAKCDYCDVGIANYKNLKRHIQLRHKDLTPNMARDLELIQISKRKKESMQEKKALTSFKCDICEKAFYDKSTLNRHKKVHTFVCKTCEKVFTSKDNLNKHMRYHDEKTDMVKIKKNVFSNKGKMEEHMNVHERKNEHTENKKRKTVSWSEHKFPITFFTN